MTQKLKPHKGAANDRDSKEPRMAVDDLRTAMFRLRLRCGDIPTAPPNLTPDEFGGSYAKLLEHCCKPMPADYVHRARLKSEVDLVSWRTLRADVAAAADRLRDVARTMRLDSSPASKLYAAMRRAPDHPPNDHDLTACFDAGAWTVAVLDASSMPAKREQKLDLVHDPACKSIRDILRAGPRMRGAINKDSRLLCSPRKAGDLLNAMAEAGMVTQTKPKGPWRFVSDEPRN